MNYLHYWQLTCLTFNLAAAPWQGIPAEGSRYIPPMPQVLGLRHATQASCEADKPIVLRNNPDYADCSCREWSQPWD